MFALPTYSAINANISFDQSLKDGLFSAWGKSLSILFAVFYQFLVRAKGVKVSTIFFIVIALSWVDVGSKFYMTLTVNPALLVDTDLVGYNPTKGGYVFRFDATLAQLACIFYFTNFIITKKLYHIIGFSLFMAYMLFVDKGRIDIMCLFVVMFFVMIRNLSAVNFVRMTFSLLIGAGIIFLIAYQIAPNEVLVVRNMLLNFVLTVAGIDTGEGSASSRFLQMAAVMKHFATYPEQMIFGIGILQRETMDLLFGHLYLSDIGIVGLFFAYGVVGVILLYGLFIYALRLTWMVRYYKDDLYYKLTESALVMLFVGSFFNGSFIWAPGAFITFLMFLHTYTLMEKDYVLNLKQETNQ